MWGGFVAKIVMGHSMKYVVPTEIGYKIVVTVCFSVVVCKCAHAEGSVFRFVTNSDASIEARSEFIFLHLRFSFCTCKSASVSTLQMGVHCLTSVLGKQDNA
jgi:hypothetical protein